MPFFGNFQVSFLHIVGLLGIEVVSHTSKNKYVKLYSPLTFLFFFGVLLLKRSKTKKLKDEGKNAVFMHFQCIFRNYTIKLLASSRVKFFFQTTLLNESYLHFHEDP